MRKILLITSLLLLVTAGSSFSQIGFSKVGDKVSVKGQYQFTIVSTGYGAEFVINNSMGSTLLVFIPFKIQDGWRSESSDTQTGKFARSGTAYTYFYRIAATSGDYCDIPVAKLYNIYNAAKFVVALGLVKSDALDKTAFDQCIAMHGKVYDNLKYFK